MLSQSGNKYNDLSPQFRADLEKRMTEAGRRVKYKFAIAQKNPEFAFASIPEASIRQFSAPEHIYPAQYDLFPVTFQIVDPYDKKRKRIGMIKEVNEDGDPIGFRRCSVFERDRGIKILDLSKPDDQDEFAFLELHPCNETGLLFDPTFRAIVKQINDVKEAKQSLKKRNLRTDAMYVAGNMADQEIKDFASGMNWDEDMEIDLLRDKTCQMADEDPERFRALMESGNMTYMATIKRAEVAGVINWVPLEYKYVWASNNQVIAAFGRQEDLNPLEKLSEYLITAKNGDAIYERIKSLLKPVRV